MVAGCITAHNLLQSPLSATVCHYAYDMTGKRATPFTAPQVRAVLLGLAQETLLETSATYTVQARCDHASQGDAHCMVHRLCEEQSWRVTITFCGAL